MGAQQGGRRRRGRRGARRLPRGAAGRRAPRVAGDPARRRPSSGAGSGSPAAPEDQRLPEAAAWGGLPAGSPLEKGDAALPPARSFVTGHAPDPAGRRWYAGSTATATCTVARRRPRRRRCRPARDAGVGGAGLRGHRPGVVAGRRSSSPRAIPTCGRPSASIPTTPPASATSGTALEALARARRRGRRRRRGRVRLLLQPLAAAATRRPRSAGTIALAHRLDRRARDPLARRVGRHVPRARRRSARHARTVFHCFTGGPDEARARARPRRVPVVQRHRVVQERGRRARRGRDRHRSTACSSRPTRRTSRRCRTAAGRTEPAWVVDVGAALAAATGRRSTRSPPPPPPTRPRCSGTRPR